VFTSQALLVDKWDRQMIQERDRVIELRQTSSRLKQGAASINAELEVILQRQDEMHLALSELEKKVEVEAQVLPEGLSARQQAYDLVESLDKELGEMREALTATVDDLKERRQAEAQGGSGQQLAQMVQVLDVHLSAFQWLDTQSQSLEESLRQVDQLMADQHTLQRMGARGRLTSEAMQD